MKTIVLLCIAFLLATPSFSQELPIPKSPFIAAAETNIAGGDVGAVGAFWTAVEKRGTPLVEPLADDKNHSLVTFVWRGDSATKNVFVQSAIYTWVLPRRQLTNIKNSDIWYLTAKIPNDGRFTYQFSVNDPRIAFPDPYDWFAIKVDYLKDPLNAKTFVYPKDADDPNDSTTVVSLCEMPSAALTPYKAVNESVAKGSLAKFDLKSGILGNERRVWLYQPNGYSPAKKYPLVVFFDGVDYLNNIPAPTILDNLIAQGRIPPVVAVFVATPFGAGIREKEYYANPQFSDFVLKELLPFAESKLSIVKKPSETTLVGLSASGFAAAYLAFLHPERFGKVVMQSPALWWGFDYYGADGEWLNDEFAEAPRKKIRFYVEIGTYEGLPSTRKGRPNAFHATKDFCRILKLKGYPFIYSEFNGAHEYVNWGESLPGALIAMMRKE